MAIDPRKRQKKLEKRASKRKDKQYQLTRAANLSLAQQLAAADQCPILQCWASDDLWDEGIGYVCLSRELANGSVAFAMFLVDMRCLGVKNVNVDVVGRITYERDIERTIRSQFQVKPMTPTAARKLVEGAVDYAHRLGLPPHAEYETAARIFGSIDTSQCTEVFEYGQDGKPYFISGPFDTPVKCRRILAALRQSCGDGGFNYLVGVSGSAQLTEAEDDSLAPPERINLPAGLELAQDAADGEESAAVP